MKQRPAHQGTPGKVYHLWLNQLFECWASDCTLSAVRGERDCLTGAITRETSNRSLNCRLHTLGVRPLLQCSVPLCTCQTLAKQCSLRSQCRMSFSGHSRSLDCRLRPPGFLLSVAFITAWIETVAACWVASWVEEAPTRHVTCQKLRGRVAEASASV